MVTFISYISPVLLWRTARFYNTNFLSDCDVLCSVHVRRHSCGNNQWQQLCTKHGHSHSTRLSHTEKNFVTPAVIAVS